MDKKRREEFRKIKRGFQDLKRWGPERLPTADELKLFERCYLRAEPTEEHLSPWAPLSERNCAELARYVA